jgi:hypothetical protein
MDLLKAKFNVIPFGVSYNITFKYRLQVKFDVNIYNDYKVENYFTSIKEVILQKNIQLVFLNLSNTIPFAQLIKSIFGNEVKVILCSHGNESGDFLHSTVLHYTKQNLFKRWLSAFALGSLLRKESLFRKQYLDMVLSISEIEDNIEKWIGAPFTFMVPRVIKQQKIDWHPKLNYFGFIGDLSHAPNYYGINEICKALSKSPNHQVEIRLVGGPESIGNALANEYPFVHYCGFLPEADLIEEVRTWAYFLNLVFYYSRGVSTKLAKALGWGIPTITTTAGNRGYPYINELLPKVESPDQMAKLLMQLTNDANALKENKSKIDGIISIAPTFDMIMKDLYPKLSSL